MKKILLTAACLFVASPAAAAVINNIYLDFYDAAGSYTGYHSFADGTLNTDLANGFVSGITWGTPDWSVWTATEVWVSTTAGNNTWAGTVTITSSAAPTNFNYTFTLADSNVAFGLIFSWSVNQEIPVLAVMHPEADGSWTPVDPIWYKGTATTPKQGMQTAPFPGQRPLFGAYAPAAVPEPASLLLIGSGLAGLAGAAARRRR